MKPRDKSYDHARIEKKWQALWEKKKIHRAKNPADKAGKSAAGVAAKKFYSLIEFPYPSGDGLHVGHIRSNTAMDIISRKRRREGYNVLYPIGWDAFGLPTENYAIKTGIQPAVVTKRNTDNFRRQLKSLGFSFDWSREINTTDPKYYKWTQWIFLQFLKAGLAYKKKMSVNWCPKDLIVLANEEVIDGTCERCGTPVEKREKEQWMLAITRYADKLLEGLDATDYGDGGTGDYVMPLLVDKSNPHQPDKPVVKRRVAHAIVFDPQAKKYLIIRNKKFGWDTVVIGGIENGESAETTARREVREETGYIDLDFKRVLGGPTEAHYYTKHKGENRIAIAQAVYFELKSGAHETRVPIADGEDKDNEILWVDAADFVSGKMVNSELPIWLARIKDPSKSLVKPLLDWPESIKESQRNWIGRSEGAEIDFSLGFESFEKNKTRFVLIHGFEGSSRTNFFPWLKAELEKRGHEVETPELPNSSKPKETEQVDYVLKNCRFDENTVVVGHSLGAVVAMKAIMKLDKPISGLVIVAAAVNPTFHTGAEDSRPFEKEFSWDFDYPLIRELTGGKIAVLSDTRESFRMRYLKYLAEKLSARLVETASAEEHFCAEKEPEILKAVTPSVPIFTTRPDTIFGVTYVVLAPEHPWVNILLSHVENKKEVEDYIAAAKNKTDIVRADATREKTGVQLKGVYATNPANGEKVPVWIADYVIADYGTGAVMAVPAHDERDFEFAKKYKLPFKMVILKNKGVIENPLEKAYAGQGWLNISEDYNGQFNEDAKANIAKKFGRLVTTYKLRDWVFSRQRYWGEPIPVIHCEKCGIVPVPDTDLPVKLPPVKNYKPTETGESPLAAISKWVNVKCPKCSGKARRETDTMPNWAGSSWYYLRYTDPENAKAFASPGALKYWTPVDWYNGGREHTTLHLLYSRFWHRFLFDQGLVPTPEPYRKRTSHGLILAKGGEKMSKSKGNVVNPDGIVAAVGADSLRLYEMFMGPFEQAIAWDENGIVGTRRFIEKVWKLREKISSVPDVTAKTDALIHKTIKKVGDDIEAMRFNTAVSALMIAVNELEKMPAVSREHYAAILQLLAPFAPHVTEELWHNLGYASGRADSVHASPWPAYDLAKIADKTVRIAVQINGKSRASFEADADATEEAIRQKALALDGIKDKVYGKDIKKVIYVKGRLVNIVIEP